MQQAPQAVASPVGRWATVMVAVLAPALLLWCPCDMQSIAGRALTASDRNWAMVSHTGSLCSKSLSQSVHLC